MQRTTPETELDRELAYLAHRRAILTLAAAAGVDHRTAERWLAGGTPRAHAVRIALADAARRLGVSRVRS